MLPARSVLIITATSVFLLGGWWTLRSIPHLSSNQTSAVPPARAPNIVADVNEQPSLPAPSYPSRDARAENFHQRLAATPTFKPGQIENGDAIALLRGWAEVDAPAAIAYAAANEAQHGRPALPAELFNRWLDRDASAAQGWFVALPPGTLRSALTPSVVSLLAPHDPPQALQLAQELSGEDRVRALAAVFSEWSATDPAAAAVYARNVIEPEEPLVAGELAANWSRDNLAAAVHWSLSLPPGPERNAALRGLVPNWTEQDAPAAAAALSALPDEAERQQCLRMVGAKWATQDAPAAIAWAASLPQEGERSPVIRAVLMEWAQSNIAEAAAAALTLPVGRSRDEAIESVLVQWAVEDHPAALEWLSRVPPGQVKAEIANTLAAVKKPRPSPARGD